MNRSTRFELFSLRQLASLLLARAVVELFPKTQLFFGGASERGFFYEVIFSEKCEQQHLTSLEERMHTLCREGAKVEQLEMARSNVLELFRDRQQKIKFKQVQQLRESFLSLTKIGDFFDIFHIPNPVQTDALSHFKLYACSEKLLELPGGQQQLGVRFEGTAFFERKELKKYLKKKEDNLGQQQLLKQMHFVDPLQEREVERWTANGSFVLNALREKLVEERGKNGFTSLISPKQDLFFWHARAYEDEKRDETALPVKFFEFFSSTWKGKKQELYPFFRTAHFIKERATIFCTEDQVEKELISLLHSILKTINMFSLKFHCYVNPGNLAEASSPWKSACLHLCRALDDLQVDYLVEEGALCPHGPNIEFALLDSVEAEWRGPTVGIAIPKGDKERVYYTDAEGTKKSATAIFCSLYGSLERFVAILLEQSQGYLPFWLTPVQVLVVPVGKGNELYAKEVLAELQTEGIRAKIEGKTEALGEKLHSAASRRIPYLFIIGDKERQLNKVSVAVMQDRSKRVTIDRKEILTQLTKENQEVF